VPSVRPPPPLPQQQGNHHCRDPGSPCGWLCVACRVAAAHRRLLLGKVFKASSPNRRFVDGAAAIEGKPLSRIEVCVKAGGRGVAGGMRGAVREATRVQLRRCGRAGGPQQRGRRCELRGCWLALGDAGAWQKPVLHVWADANRRAAAHPARCPM